MNDSEITSRLASTYALTDDAIASLHWKDRLTQVLRLNLLCQLIPEAQENCFSLLDAGCGLGDLCAIVKQTWPKARYYGIDIIPSFVRACQEQYPDSHFQVSEILEVEQEFDYTVASGVFNEIPPTVASSQFRDWVWRRIVHLWNISKKGVIFNGIAATQIKWRNPKNLYWDMADLATRLGHMSRFFVIKHDYPLYEFTAAVYRPRLIATIFGNIGDWR